MFHLCSCATPAARTRVPFLLPVRPLGWTVSAVLLVAAGCARTPIQPPPNPVPHSEPSVLGVAVLEPVSDVADLTEAVRHVMGPSGLLFVPSPGSAASSMPPSPETVSGTGAMTVSEHVGVTEPPIHVDPPDTLDMSAPDDPLLPPAAPAAEATASPEPVPSNASVPAAPPETGQAVGFETGPPPAGRGGTGRRTRTRHCTPRRDPGRLGTLLCEHRPYAGAMGDYRPDIDARVYGGAVGDALPPGEVSPTSRSWRSSPLLAPGGGGPRAHDARNRRSAAAGGLAWARPA